MSFTIAIVGRPNVGKSTLFNRLVGRRVALALARTRLMANLYMDVPTWIGEDNLFYPYSRASPAACGRKPRPRSGRRMRSSS